MTKPLPKPGAHRVPFLEYVGWSALNWSTLKHWRKSALAGRHASLLPQDATEDMVFGDAFHAAVLEPDRFGSQYAVMPKFDGHPNSNAHKAAKAQWIEANRAKVHLTHEEYNAIKSMGEAVRRHPVAGPIIGARGRNELSIAWHDKETGVLMKARIDALRQCPYGLLKPSAANGTTNVIVVADLKSTKDASAWAFAKDVARYGYHAQAAVYLDGLDTLESGHFLFVNVAVEKEAPHDCVVYLYTDEAIEAGRQLYRRLLALKLESEEAQRFPGMAEDGAIVLQLPKWAGE